MYIPPAFACNDHALLEKVIQDFGFATLVSSDLQFSQLPLLLCRDAQGEIELIGHMARANPHWQTLEAQTVLAIFHGPHSYISPSWYKTHPGVPTWNYISVEARGTLHLVDKTDTLGILKTLSDFYDPGLWGHTDIMPAAFVEKLCEHLLGFRIQGLSLQGKFKLNQNKSLSEQREVLATLSKQRGFDAQALASYWASLLPTKPTAP